MRIMVSALMTIAFTLPANAQMLTYDEFQKSRQRSEKPTQKSDQVSRKYKRYIDRMREPILMWGLGHLGATSVDMKGKLNFGKGKEVNSLWTNMNISKNLQVGGGYSFLGKNNYLPKFYLFAGTGLGVELGAFDSYVYTSLSALYFFNRNYGVQVAVNMRVDKPEGLNADTVGIFFQYRH